MEFEIKNEKWTIKELNLEEMYKENHEEFVDDGSYIFGLTCPAQKKIYLYKELDEFQKRKTLMHELMHCYLFTYVSFNPIEFSIDDFCDISANSHDIIHKIVNDYFKIGD